MNGALWSFIASSGYQIFGLLIFVVLSHALTPVDFGVMAIAIVFIEILSTVVRMGMMESVIREKELAEDTVNTVFWVTFFVGLFFSVSVYLFSATAAVIFDMPVLENVLKVLSFLPLVHALGTVHEGLLLRDYQFKSLAFRTLIATSVSGVIAIILAMNDFGVYSLVVQRVLSVVILTSSLWYYVRWFPKPVFSFIEAKKLSFIGFPVMVTSLVGVAMYKVVDVFVGLFLGPAAVGYLHLAGKLHDFIFQFTLKPILDVSLTTFSKLQDHQEELNKAYHRLVQFCSVMAFPAFLGLAVLAPGLIEFVFGAQWGPSVILTQIFCLASLSSTLNYFFRPLMLAVGEGVLVLRVGLLHLALTTISVFIASQISIVAVLVGHLIVSSLLTIIIVWITQRKVGAQISQLVRDLLPSVVSAVIMASLLLIIRLFIEDTLGVVMLTALLVVLGGLFYVSGLFLLFPSFVKQVKVSFLPTILERFKKGS